MTRSPVRIALILVLVLFAIGILIVCISQGFAVMSWFRGESLLPTGYALGLEEVIVLDEDGQTTVQGQVIQDPACGGDAESCYFYLDYKGFAIRVHYMIGEAGTGCKNEASASVARTLGSGDEVEVFGRYLGDGAIAICDSEDYYIRVVP